MKLAFLAFSFPRTNVPLESTTTFGWITTWHRLQKSTKGTTPASSHALAQLTLHTLMSPKKSNRRHSDELRKFALKHTGSTWSSSLILDSFSRPPLHSRNIRVIRMATIRQTPNEQKFCNQHRYRAAHNQTDKTPPCTTRAKRLTLGVVDLFSHLGSTWRPALFTTSLRPSARAPQMSRVTKSPEGKSERKNHAIALSRSPRPRLRAHHRNAAIRAVRAARRLLRSHATSHTQVPLPGDGGV